MLLSMVSKANIDLFIIRLIVKCTFKKMTQYKINKFVTSQSRTTAMNKLFFHYQNNNNNNNNINIRVCNNNYDDSNNI